MEPVFNLSGLNLQTSPLQQQSGDTLVAINVDLNPIGALTKRAGINTFLGTPDNSQINTLMSWQMNDGTTRFLYRASGSALYYSQQGTAPWTLAAGGTISNGGTVRSAVINNTMILGDGVGSTRHTTDGTTFTNTTLAPVASDFIDYQQRIYAAGTSSTLFYSTTGDATNWNTSGTSDSSSLNIPGAGKLLRVVKLADRLITHKNSGIMHRWDGQFLVDMATTLAMSSPASFAKTEDYGFYINRLGMYGHDGGRPQLLSRLIQPQIYNDSGSAIAGTQFDVAQAGVHKYQYFVSVGTITDDFVQKTIPNAVITYDFLQNSLRNYQFSFLPTAYCSYKDVNGVLQLIMGDNQGQVYQQSGTATTDNGTAIYAEAMGVIHGGTLLDKKWNRIRGAFNPGCEAQVSIAITDSFRIPTDNRKWKDLGDARSGIVDYRFPPGSRGAFLFWKIVDYSKTSRFTFYGFEQESEVIPKSS